MLLRFMTGDHERQAAIALAILDEDFVLTATVLVETEWVLRSRYGWDRDRRTAGLRMVIDLPHAVDIPENTGWAIRRMAAGADFADMMHLAGSRGASGFATFDRDLAREAGRDPPVTIETLA